MRKTPFMDFHVGMYLSVTYRTTHTKKGVKTFSNRSLNKSKTNCITPKIPSSTDQTNANMRGKKAHTLYVKSVYRIVMFGRTRWCTSICIPLACVVDNLKYSFWGLHEPAPRVHFGAPAMYVGAMYARCVFFLIYFFSVGARGVSIYIVDDNVGDDTRGVGDQVQQMAIKYTW